MAKNRIYFKFVDSGHFKNEKPLTLFIYHCVPGLFSIVLDCKYFENVYNNEYGKFWITRGFKSSI